jgi:hypothetical protein
MRLIYNPSGTSHARDALRIEQRSKQRRMYTASEKMKIVREVDAMMATENLPLNVAAARHGVNPTSVKTWRKNAVALSDSSVENKLMLHKGPPGIVWEVKEELIEFVEHWRSRGFPVTRMCLMRKVCKVQIEAGVPTEELCCAPDGDFSLSHEKWLDPPHGDPQGSARSWRGARRGPLSP